MDTAAQKEVRRIKDALAELNALETAKGIISSLPVSNFTVNKLKHIDLKEKRALAALENAWYGTYEQGKYSHAYSGEGE